MELLNYHHYQSVQKNDNHQKQSALYYIFAFIAFEIMIIYHNQIFKNHTIRPSAV